MENIKDYIIDIKENEKDEEKPVIKKKASVEYSVKLSSGSDFVINRKTPKTDRDFVFIPSKNQIYIKDNKKEEIEVCSKDDVKRFFSDLTELEVGATSVNVLNKMTLEIIFKSMRNKYFNKFLSKQYKIRDIKNIYAYKSWQISNKAFDEIFKVVGSYDETPGAADYYYHICFFDAILQHFGIDKMRYILQQIYLSPLSYKFLNNYDERIECANQKNSYLSFIFDKLKNWDYKSVIDYLYYESYRQGEVSLISVIIAWIDTLRMEKAVYGKIKEKYPANLRTYHNILTLKYNLIKEEYEKMEFEEAVNEYKDLQYNGKEYAILIPEGPGDLADEGVSLSHCVKSYIKNVANQTSKIVFMRSKTNLSESLITIEVVGQYIKQVRGYKNRAANKDEMNFVNEWAKEKNLLNVA